MRKTKIVCTLGPASSNEKTIEAMLRKGMNVARLNFSHGTHENHKKTIEMFRKIRDKLQVPAAILLDTKGPEIRVKEVENGSVELVRGNKVVLTTQDILGTSERISITYKDLPKKIKAGDNILIDDGNIKLNVLEVSETEITCIIKEGGPVKNKKSLNLPNIPIDMPYLSENDKADLIFGIENDVDFIAASFVRSKEDVIDLRRFLDYNGGHDIYIIAKIENSQGVDNFNEILEHSDGIMIARGDMGVEIEFERLPGIQKMFIKRCYQSGKMVITATQMLESMITHYTPTRAEITDVANAVFDGTSAVMLSGETAVGEHPERVVEVMATIARQAEKDAFKMRVYEGISYVNDSTDTTNAICDAACTTAKDINAKAIIAVTKEGGTARRVSKFRPVQHIVASTPIVKTFHQLALSWGVFPVLARSQDDIDALFVHAIDCAKNIDLVSKGDLVVITAGVPLNTSGTTNLLKVELV